MAVILTTAAVMTCTTPAMAEGKVATDLQDAPMGKPRLHVLDLGDDSLRSSKPKVPPAADDSLARRKARGGALDVPPNGIAFYVETEEVAKVVRGVTLTGPKCCALQGHSIWSAAAKRCVNKGTSPGTSHRRHF